MTIGSTSSNEDDLHPAPGQKNTPWLIPSIGDLILVALLGLLCFTALSLRLLGDAGIGWHIRTGQLILATHAIPHVDPFSSTMAGHPWFAWEWLYDVLVGGLDGLAGLNGVVFFTAAIIALVFSCTFRLLLRWGTNFLVALVLVLLAASAAMIHFFARPHVVSWLFTLLYFWILESSEREAYDSSPAARRHFLWMLPPLMLIWVNVHGGFLVGFVLLGIYSVGAARPWFSLKEDRLEDALQKIRAGKRTRDLTIITACSAVATLANPYGWRLHVHIYRYLSNRFLMDHIDEFQSPNFHGVAQKCFAMLLLLTLISLAARRREASHIRLSPALVVLFSVYSGLYASRNIPLSALLLILVIGPWLSDAAHNLAAASAKRRIVLRSQDPSSPDFLQRMQQIELSLRTHLWPVAAIVLTGWIAFHGGRLGATPLMRARFDSKRFPVSAVDYLEKHNVFMIHATWTVKPSPVFGPDYWGGYLIYRLYPQTKVAIDDRHDFYGEEFLGTYLKMLHVEPGWEDFLKQHEARMIVIPRDSALANILLETPRWQPVYTDEVAIVFTQTPPPPR